MQAAILANDLAAVDADNVAPREHGLQDTPGISVLRDPVGRQQYGAVDQQEVGVGRRQPTPVTITQRTPCWSV